MAEHRKSPAPRRAAGPIRYPGLQDSRCRSTNPTGRTSRIQPPDAGLNRRYTYMLSQGLGRVCRGTTEQNGRRAAQEAAHRACREACREAVQYPTPLVPRYSTLNGETEMAQKPCPEKYLKCLRDAHGNIKLEYFKGLWKPYVKQLFTPNGTPILGDGTDRTALCYDGHPLGEPHVHGLMYAIDLFGQDNVHKQVNFWGEERVACPSNWKGSWEAGEPGYEKHRSFERSTSNSKFTEYLDWYPCKQYPLPPHHDCPKVKDLKPIPTAKSMLSETRTLEVSSQGSGPDAYTLLTWHSELSPLSDVSLFMANAWHGLGMLFSCEFLDGYFKDENGKVKGGQHPRWDTSWCAFFPKAKEVTIAVFAIPTDAIADNSKPFPPPPFTTPSFWMQAPSKTFHPTYSFLSATLYYQNDYKKPDKSEPLPVPRLYTLPGETVKLTYGVALWDAKDPDIAQAYLDWYEANDPNPG